MDIFENLTKEQRKQFIMECVSEFVKKFPIEYAAICENVKRRRKLQKDDFGLMEKKQFGKEGHEGIWMRWTLRIPLKLFNILDKNLKSPRFLEEDWEINWFKKTFPEFRVSEKT